MGKILIIDDDEELCELVSEYLTVEGFDIESVNDGQSGLDRALSGDYEMAILDVMSIILWAASLCRNGAGSSDQEHRYYGEIK